MLWTWQEYKNLSGFADTLPTLHKIPLRLITALWPPLKEHIAFILKGQADQEKHSESNAQGCK